MSVHRTRLGIGLIGVLVFAAAMSILRANGAAVDPGKVRVVSQTVGTDELLLALAEPTQIASLSHLAREPVYSAVAEEAKAHPALEKLSDAESILKFRPTLVLFADYSRVELVTQIRRAGIRVIVFDRYFTLSDAFANLRTLARELGPAAEERAERLIDDGERRVAALRKALERVRPVKVIAPSTYGLIPGDQSTFQDLCDHAGAENLAFTLGRLSGHAAPPAEAMLTWPIEKVVLSGTDRASALAPFQRLPPYQHMKAVREGAVALIEPWQLSSVTHRRIEGYERLARELHPEVFR